MNRVSALFLTAKHWQIFVVLFVVPYAAIAATVVFPSAVYVSIATMLLYALFTSGWYWSLGRFVASVVDPALRLNPIFFHLAIVYPLFYVPVFVWDWFRQNSLSAGVIIPLHLLAMFCILYVFTFVAKNLAMVETGKPASLSDYAIPFVLLWFFPIGVWMIQPKVNRLYSETEAARTRF